MRAHYSIWMLSILLSIPALPFAGCGSSTESASIGEAAGAGGEAGSAGDGGHQGAEEGGEAGAPSAGAGGAAGAGLAGAAGMGAVGGAGGEAGSENGGGGGEGGELETARCDPTSEDAPDDDFVDSNCDGIDGDASRAVFVAPAGKDDASGTRDAPFGSLAHAVELAVPKKLSIYVCNGTYRENLVIRSGISIYGGYDCTRAWTRVKDHAVLQPTDGLPLVVDSVAGDVVIDRLSFRAGRATKPGTSSQAAGIINSAYVHFWHSEFSAGDGAPGLDGTPGASAPSAPPNSGANGTDSVRTDCTVEIPSPACGEAPRGGRDVSLVCAFDGGTYETSGGEGGDGTNPWLLQGKKSCLEWGSPHQVGLPGHYRINGGSWEVIYPPSDLSQLAGRSGGGAQLGIGSLDGVLYVASNAGAPGGIGLPGIPGAGGDGGAYAISTSDVCSQGFASGSGGGQGGPGGCGGTGGTGGLGGGASIALVIVKSQVQLDWASLVTGNGGNGGAGALGGAGQPGGLAGSAGKALYSSIAGAPGKPGTAGGTGGSGGPGGGGPSIGILYIGVPPIVNASSYSLGLPGNGGTLVGGGAAEVGVTSQLYELTP